MSESVADTFTFVHVVCGEIVSVVGGVEQPHRCRIDLDAQKSDYRTPGDWEPLGEDVTMHSMLGFYSHEDGRACAWHSRLDAWTFGSPRDKKCLRPHIPDEARGPSDLPRSIPGW